LVKAVTEFYFISRNVNRRNRECNICARKRARSNENRGRRIDKFQVGICYLENGVDTCVALFHVSPDQAEAAGWWVLRANSRKQAAFLFGKDDK
jgi:CRISPR/Cas system-associated protein Cas10 (large subunit of type III CRISPR-Cas system)